MNKTLFCVIVSIMFLRCVALAASVDKAVMLYAHGLGQEAKSELIEVIFSNANGTEKAEAYYTLGSIAFTEGNIKAAYDTWNALVIKYPKSTQAISVSSRMDLLAEIVGESAAELVQDAIAMSYLRNGDFWSNGKDEIFYIDTSWLPHVEPALKWYDKVILEFPGTAASRIAHQSKLFTLLGWKGPGQYGQSYGIEASFINYMPELLGAFSDFEREYPGAQTLQNFRFQIAQTYWGNKDWINTREWLQKVIDNAGSGDSFYKATAELRLTKIEH